MFRNIITGLILGFVWLIAAFWFLNWWVEGLFFTEMVTAGALAVLATLVFINERFEFNLRARPQPRPEKQKRTPESETETTMRLLLEMMDVDEREAFKAEMKQRLLNADPDDVPTLGALLKGK